MFEPLPPIYDSQEELDDLFLHLDECLKIAPRLAPKWQVAESSTTSESNKSSESSSKNAKSSLPTFILNWLYNFFIYIYNLIYGPASSISTYFKPSDGGLATRSLYMVDGATGPTQVASWKFQEFFYSKPDVVFPIRARGLFTHDGKIVARGYDKFFNVDEVAATKLEVLRKLPGPFSAATKENGCIILISGLADGTLLVCSKHSTGKPVGRDFAFKHVEHGNKAVHDQLKRVGKTSKQLAETLYKMNVTAVLELCDDSFEEHIVKYPPELSGLYLHGLNFNVKEFKTYPLDKVEQFADVWGFRKVEYTVFDKFDELWQFLEKLKVKGVYHGRELEGFVVRSQNNDLVHFFKYKFDEPYFLFRQFRSVSLKLIGDKRQLKKDEKITGQPIAQIMRSIKKHKAITLDYLQFVKKLFDQDEQLVNDYRESIGIIKLREQYLAYKGLSTTSGMDLLGYENDEILSEKLMALMDATKVHYVIMPMAVPASGKTTVFMTLNNLFPEWKHIQNDNVISLDEFHQQVAQGVNDSQICLADKNFHMTRIRKEFFEGIESARKHIVPPDIAIAYIGVNFLSDINSKDFLEISEKRLLDRGDNHQSIKAGADIINARNVLNGFHRSAIPPKVKKTDDFDSAHVPLVIEGKYYQYPDNNCDIIINVNINGEHSSLDIAKKILSTLQLRFPDIATRDISELEWTQAYEAAKSYKPTFTKNIAQGNGDNRRAEYYGVGIKNPEQLRNQINELLNDNTTWKHLILNNRVQKEFHVTLAHISGLKEDETISEPAVKEAKEGESEPKKTKKNKKVKSAKTNQERWQQLGRRFEVLKLRESAKSGERIRGDQTCDIQLQKIVVVEKKLVVLKVELSDPYKQVNGVWTKQNPALEPLNKYLHITMGTYSKDIPPMQSNIYLTALYENFEGLPEGEYEWKGNDVKVYDVDLVLEKQPVFVQFRRFKGSVA
ncbi:CIC11C00000005611 [Sungouiella intermedia]|uniref:CIC11C00000005611 n=1 Tax=Sungouiella intermedia TaxID=45354 RepID=A0A1L0D7X9_9ASCO|nr:CIC11C00000005611 [[Candida] intermedia]